VYAVEKTKQQPGTRSPAGRDVGQLLSPLQQSQSPFLKRDYTAKLLREDKCDTDKRAIKNDISRPTPRRRPVSPIRLSGQSSIYNRRIRPQRTRVLGGQQQLCSPKASSTPRANSSTTAVLAFTVQ